VAWHEATETAREILAEHHPDPLPDDLKQELEKEVEAIYRREGIEYTPFPV